ncbi:MAG: mechanosensitive ion channel family protein [Bacteroidales bacterium]
MTAHWRLGAVLRHVTAASAFAAAAFALATSALCQQTPPAPPAAAASVPQGVPVTLDGEVLYYVYEGIGTLTVEERAEVAERRLLRIAEDPFYSTSEISIAEKGNSAQIVYRGTIVGILNAEEAARIGTGTTTEVAEHLVGRIAHAIEAYRARRQPVAKRRAAAFALLATFLLAVALAALRRLHRWLVARLEAASRAPEEGPGVVQTMVRSLDKTASLQRRALRVLRFALSGVLIVVYLFTIFDLFPLTRGYAASVANYFLDPLRIVYAGIWDNIGNFIFIVVITVLTRYLLKGLRLLLSEAAAGTITLPGVQPDWALLLYKALRLVVVAIAAVMIYPYIPGSDSEAFKGISLFAGALFTLGASGMAGNMIGGLVLTFSGSYHVGDRVKIGDVTGDVLQTTLMLTRIRSVKNEVVTIPNSSIMGGHVVNYSAIARTKGLLLTTEVTIGYDAPWRKVHALLVDAALRTRRILRRPAPFALQKSLNDYHVSYVLCAFTDNANLMILTYGELHQNIQDAFNEGGIEILSPAFSYLRDGRTTTIPADYRPDGYQPEPFEVKVDTPGVPR